MTRPTNEHPHLHLFLDTLVALNLDQTLWRCEATRAKKNPGKGERHHVILALRDTRGDVHIPGYEYLIYDVRGWCWADRGYFDRWKVIVQSPTPSVRWVAFHSSTTFVTGQSRALDLLDVLAQRLVETKL